MLQDIFVISHSPSGMETGKSKSEERSQLLTDPVVTGIAYEINKANKQLNQHRLQVLHQLRLGLLPVVLHLQIASSYCLELRSHAVNIACLLACRCYPCIQVFAALQKFHCMCIQC